MTKKITPIVSTSSDARNIREFLKKVGYKKIVSISVPNSHAARQQRMKWQDTIYRDYLRSQTIYLSKETDAMLKYEIWGYGPVSELHRSKTTSKTSVAKGTKEPSTAKKKPQTQENRKNAIRKMNREIIKYGDEEILNTWFSVGFPDGGERDGYVEIIAADEESFNDLVKVYNRLKGRMKSPTKKSSTAKKTATKTKGTKNPASTVKKKPSVKVKATSAAKKKTTRKG